jgi:cytochrome c553
VRFAALPLHAVESNTYNMRSFLVPLCYVVYACVVCHSQKSNKSDQFIVELAELLAKVLHQSLNYEFTAKSVGGTNYIRSSLTMERVLIESLRKRALQTAAQLEKAARK